MEIIRQATRNATRHFIVWGTLATIIMFAGLAENGSGTAHLNKPAPQGSYEQVMTEFTCEDVPEGEFPGAVVLQEVGGGVVVSINPVHIGKALDEEFSSKEWKRFDAIQFCG